MLFCRSKKPPQIECPRQYHGLPNHFSRSKKVLKSPSEVSGVRKKVCDPFSHPKESRIPYKTSADQRCCHSRFQLYRIVLQ
nr:hypothetical protein [uncultured bacterium]